MYQAGDASGIEFVFHADEVVGDRFMMQVSQNEQELYTQEVTISDNTLLLDPSNPSITPLLTQAGTYTYTFLDPDSGYSFDHTIEVLPGPIHRVMLDTFSSQMIQATTIQGLVQVQDAFGNLVTGYNQPITLTADAAQIHVGASSGSTLELQMYE